MPWDEVLHKWKAGTLKSGGDGKPVKSQKQAVAIMLSEKRAASDKPEYRSKKFTHSKSK
jgi:parvulin-like peptidyl-prolyl isomerase